MLMRMTILDWYREQEPRALLGQLSDAQKSNITVSLDASNTSTLIFMWLTMPPNKLFPDGGKIMLTPEAGDQWMCDAIREFAIPPHAHCRCNPDVGESPCEWCEMSEPWFYGEVRTMAAGIIKNKDFGCTDLLADRLEERGCNYELLLQHLRGKIPCIHKYLESCSCDNGWQTKPIDCMELCWALWLILGNTQKLHS